MENAMGMEVLFCSFKSIFLLHTPCDTHIFFVVHMPCNPHMQTPAPDQNTSSKSPFYLARHLWYAALWSCLSATPSLQTMLSQSRMRTASFTFRRFKVFTCIFRPLRYRVTQRDCKHNFFLTGPKVSKSAITQWFLGNLHRAVFASTYLSSIQDNDRY